MQYTRRELLDIFLDFVGENEDSNARNTAERLLNFAVQTIWSKMAWQQFDLPTPYTFATASGTASYPLPPYFGRVRDGRLRNTTTGGLITPTTLETLALTNPAYGTSLDAGGTPQVYAIGGTVGVDVQVAAAGEAVTAVSDSASDTGVKVEVAGLDSNSRYRRYQATLNGLTPIAMGTWKKVIEATKSYPAGTDAATEYTSSVGNVSFTGATAGVLVQLANYESALQRMELTLWPTPNVVNTISVPMSRAPTKLLYDADMTPLGWGPALLEEMNVLWQVNSGDLKSTAMVPRPMLLDLICLENSNRFGVPSRTRPFTG